jgi:predicted DNA binding CopG/RHH family protein
MDMYFVLNDVTFIMKIEALKKRLDKNRPMTSITIRIPEDVIEDLKRVAPLLGFSGYQPLVRAYLGQGLRADLERLEGDTVSALVASLKRHGVNDEVIQEALNEVAQR